jgi:hypothetical protein
MFISKPLAHFAEMFPQAIDFGTDGINFKNRFYHIKYIWFYYVCFFQKIDFMLDGSLVFGINPRFYAYYTVIADPAFWCACCYLEMVCFFQNNKWVLSSSGEIYYLFQVRIVDGWSQ